MTALMTDVCGLCGNLRSVCSDPSRPLFPQRSYCYVTAVEAVTRRRVDAKHSHPDSKSGELHFTDGLTIRASEFDLTPDDDFLGDSFLRGGPEQGASDLHDTDDAEH